MQNSNTISLLSGVIKKNAIISALLVVGMLGIFLTTGIGQDPLQYVHSISGYRDILLQSPTELKLAIGLDNAFILFYLSMFIALGLVLSRLEKLNLIGKVAMLFLFITAILDIFENMHFLTMISAAKEGFVISENEINIQVWESLVKFHISYIGFYLLSFVFTSADIKERILCFLLRWVQWPVGMLIYITPIEIAKPLVLVRFTFFLSSLILLATLNFNQHSDKTDQKSL